MRVEKRGNVYYLLTPVPRDLKVAVKQRAVLEGTTSKAIVLRALKDAGFPVSDEDLIPYKKPRNDQ